MALNFPSSPNINDTFTGGGKVWTWDGSSWRGVTINSSVPGSNGQLVYSNNGNAAATSDLIYDPVNNRVGIGNTAPLDKLSVNGTTYFGANVNVVGTVNATSFSGNGSLLTSIDATTVGGNTASTLRSYSDTQATGAYNSAVTYTDTKIGTANGAITGNAATAYSNSVSYTDSKILTANGAIAGNAATAYSNSVSYTDTRIGTVNTAITSNASAAYSNAVTYIDGKILTANGAITGNAATAYTNAVSYTDGKILTANGAITGNAATAYTNAVSYTDGKILTANGAITGNAATAYTNSVSYTDSKILTANSAITGNAATAYTNATTFASNASNITTGSLAFARLPSVDAINNTSITLVPVANNVKTAYDAAITANTNAASAYSNAVTYVDTKIGTANTAITGNAATAYTNAVSYTDSKILTANGAITGNATTAYTNAVSYTDSKILTANGAITGNAATAYSNATSYTDSKILTANGAITGNAATAYTNAVSYTDSKILTANSAITGNAATAYTNATTFASNASNISTGTLAEARLPYRIDQNVRTTDAVSFGSLTLTGNLTVGGTTTTVSAQNLSVTDNMIYMNNGVDATITGLTANGTHVVFTANNNFAVGWDVVVTGVTPSGYNATYTNITAANSTTFTVLSSTTGTYTSGGTARGKTDTNPDIGFAAGYNDGAYKHTGFFRDATDDYFKPFTGYTPEPDASPFIDTANASFTIAGIHANDLRLGNTSVYATINSTVYSGTANNSTYLGGSTLATVQGQITGNAATAYTNAVSYTDSKILTANGAITGNAATAYSNAVSYTDSKILTANGAITGNAATAYSNAVSYTDGKILTANGAITGNAATAYTNATTFASNASNITTGTLPYARIPANIVNTTAAFTLSGIITHSGNVVLGSVGLSANGGFGSAGQVLHSNGTATYWAADDDTNTTYDLLAVANTAVNEGIIRLKDSASANDNVLVSGTGTTTVSSNATHIIVNSADQYVGTVTSVATGNGLTGGTITATGTVSILANTGIVANSTGAFVNSSYIATISSNNATYFDGSSLATIQGQITGNAATAYTNSVSYTDTKIGTANTAITGNAATAYSNATTFAANASNISSGTVAFARLPSLYIGTTTIQSTSAAQAVSGITTLAAGNTTITGFANVSTTLQVGNSTFQLGGTATNNVNNFIIQTNNGNQSYLRFYTYRHTTGSDWTGASTRIQQRIDVTDQAWIEFNPSGYSYGIGVYGSGGKGLTVDTNGITNHTANVAMANNYIVAPVLQAYSERLTALGSVTGTIGLDLSVSNFFTLTATGNITFSYSNAPTGRVFAFTIVFTQDATGGRTITWPTGTKWPGGVVPPATTTANAIDIWSVMTYDGGTTWIASLSVKNAS